MKYPSASAFEKHLTDSHLAPLSPVYLIVCASEFERKLFMKRVLAEWQKREKGLQLVTYEASSFPLEELALELRLTVRLEPCLLYYDGIDKVKEKGALLTYLDNPSEQTPLVLGANSMKPLSDLYLRGKKEMVVLDLTEEKPWEREKRATAWVVREAKRQGKEIALEAVQELLRRVGSDFAFLTQEVDKLITYVGERGVIGAQDVALLTPRSVEEGSWQLAEEVVFKGAFIPARRGNEEAFFFPFLGQLSYLLHAGRDVASFLEAGKSLQEVAALLPQVKSKSLEQYARASKAFKKGYFERGLKHLYEMEVAAKTGYSDLSLLLDRFVGKLKG